MIIKALTSFIILPLIFSPLLIIPSSVFSLNPWNWFYIILLSYLLIAILLSLYDKLSNSNNFKSYTDFIVLYSFSCFFAAISYQVFYDLLLLDINSSLRASWKVSYLFIIASLSVSPIINIFKNIEKKDIFIMLRKIFGIISFVFFLKHWIEYFIMDYYYEQYSYPVLTVIASIIENVFARTDVFIWIFAWIIILLLWLTSNNFSQLFLWVKNWKILHKSAYLLLFVVLLHIAFASRFDWFYTLLFLFLISMRLISFVIPNNQIIDKTKMNRYVCNPCGYIYTEAMWDPDWWILPWTKFDDIPNSWVCPVCWATKPDFKIINGKIKTIEWELVGYKMLTNNVLEIKVKFNIKLHFLPWQYMQFSMHDEQWEFIRNYSILEWTNNIFTFAIKLIDNWRGSQYLKKVLIWDKISIIWVSGNFLLQKCKYKKVFIATWTWITPIIPMLKFCNCYKTLFFGVATKSDLIYEEILSSISKLEVNIFLSQQDLPWYNNGRIDVNSMNYDLNTEFYISGNKNIVEDMWNRLSKKWYKKIYLEKYL